MNETIMSMLKRRSIRSYTKEQVSNDDIAKVLEAGIHAATARNNQPWHFTVVQKQSLIDQITNEAVETMRRSDDALYLSKVNNPDFTLFYHAPTVIIISGDVSAPHATADCANAAQNMCVAAYSLGLGSCYIASFTRAFHDPEVAGQLLIDLEIPDGYQPRFAISLGHSASDNPQPATRKRDVVSYIR